MNGNWKNEAKALACELNEAHTVAIFGLCGVSLEDQHRAFRLARRLGAYVSVERPLLPTLTRGSLKRHALILLAGGEADFAPPKGGRVLRDERLLSASAWRALRILQRGRTTSGAETYREVYEAVVSAGGAVFLPGSDTVCDALRRELYTFRSECELPLGLDILQICGEVNLQGAYETALEEAGGAHASFSGGEGKADDAFRFDELLKQDALGAALLIGKSADGVQSVLDAGVPLYVLGGEVPGAKRCIPAARLGVSDGGTVLREDGVPITFRAKRMDCLPKLRYVLEALCAETEV
jgi:hypothetical protein